MAVTRSDSEPRKITTYLLIYSISAIVISLLLTIILLFRQTIGSLIVSGDSIYFEDKKKQINLSSIQILLNCDTFEFECARKDATKLKEILKTGNRITSNGLPFEQTNWELILTKESRKILLYLENKKVIVTPQFESRPLLMISPGNLLKTIGNF